jgi:FdhE protein
MTPQAVAAGRWMERRRRAEALGERYPFAREVLALYGALLDPQERAFAAAQSDPPDAQRLAGYVADRVFPAVVDATLARGPAPLAGSVRDRTATGDPVEIVRGWLAGEDQPPVDRYLARAAVGPVLEALGQAAGAACSGPRDARHCPACGGPPQVSYFALSAEDLVTARRYLVCARCAAVWSYPRLTCAACGEATGSRLSVFAEEGTSEIEVSGRVVRGAEAVRRQASARDLRFPHVRIEACDTCARYLLSIDMARDPKAVPVVDEMAAIPLDLYAAERGLAKVVPNLMGV